MLSTPQKSGTIVWVVAVAMVNERGETLVQLRPSSSAHGNLWEFPGGKIDQGESPHAAAVREIYEELGVTIAMTDLHPISFATEPSETLAAGSSSVAILLFLAKRWQGTPEPAAAARLAWTAPEELENWAMPPLDYPLAKALAKMLARADG